MLILSCPFCGERDESEFVCAGPARAPRMTLAAATDDAWVDYLTAPPNPKGVVRERWWHSHGCGEWLIVERDTLTHAIHATRGARHEHD
ncbi:MAG: sarcosine oxidase subunit delta [Rhodospirillales bacterium]|nr:sarcosine oxidase subunit delta [Rhodospirillales bacterium]